MTDYNQIAIQTLLSANNLADSDLYKIMDILKSPSVDYADLYFQSLQREYWDFEDGIVKTGGFTIDQGVGMRAISGDKTGYAYSDDLNIRTLQQTAEASSAIAHSGNNKTIAIAKKKLQTKTLPQLLYQANNPLGTLTDNQKVDLLKAVDAEARRQDQRVHQVMVNLSGAYEIILIINDAKELIADIRPMVKLSVTVIVSENNRYETGFAGGGHRTGYEFFLENDRALSYARESVRIALVNLQAKPAPAGRMQVVLGHGWPAVLIHEAVGHGLEGDFIRKGTSLYTDKLGEQVASPMCNIVDCGNLPGALRGSLNVDDEGTPTQSTTLIENGILCGFMQDKLNAQLSKTTSTGNGRRESYAYMPLPRMTNTYMLAGNHEPEEIISSVDKGLYAVNFRGGQVDITSGEFVFSMSEAYLIEKGKIICPVKGATLIGNGPEVLTKISMVGNDLELDPGVGVCGKDGQSVPIGVGQPTLKISSITVGGQAHD